jgi:hypothetical protein
MWADIAGWLMPNRIAAFEIEPALYTSTKLRN